MHQKENNNKMEEKAKRKAKVKNAPGKAKALTRTSMPAAIGSTGKTNKPRITNAPDGSVVVKHREYISDVIAATPFTTQSLKINPAMVNVFPWLSSLAVRFERYTFLELSFHYESTCAVTETGTVMLAMDYDSADSAPDSKTKMLSYDNAVRCAPWSHAAWRAKPIELQRSKDLYVRAVTVLPPNQDIKTFDLGKLIVGRGGSGGSGNVLGELYVEYTIRLETPQLDSVLPTFQASSTAGILTSSMFGTNPVYSSTNTIDITVYPAFITFNTAFEGFIIYKVVAANFASGGSNGGSTAQMYVLFTSVGTNLTTHIAVFAVNAEPGQTMATNLATLSGAVSMEVRAVPTEAYYVP